MTTKPTADDAVSVSPATGEALQYLEDAAAYFRSVGMHGRQAQIEAAIDRLIVLDGATPPADAALADVLRLIDEQFGHAADVGATYIAFTQDETKRIAAALRARAVPAARPSGDGKGGE